MTQITKLVLYLILMAEILLVSCNEDEPIAIPEPPTNLVAIVVSDSQIDLTWTDNSSGEVSFKVERKTGTDNFSIVGTTAQDVNAYSDNNLTSHTTYTYRVYAENSAGVSDKSNEASGTTEGLPLIATSSISSITTFSALSGGTITDEGGTEIIAKGVVWGTSTNPTIDLPTKTMQGTGGDSFSSDLTGLEWETTYFVRAYATNSTGTGYGDEITFTTEPVEIITSAITDTTLISATSGGSITGDGGSSIGPRGAVWSTSPNPTVNLTSKTEDGNGSGTFSSAITGLDWETKYYVRAYATNSTNTQYGNEISFTTQPIEITTSPVIEITHKAATSGGLIVGDVGSSMTGRGIVWDTNPNPTISLDTKSNDGTGVDSYISSITDLSPNSTYYVRAFVSNSNRTDYGNELAFVTLDTVIDIVDNVYPIIQIGTQMWMAENLKTTKYNDGTDIPTEIDNSAWNALNAGAYSWWENNEANSADGFGTLYNWYSVETGKLCPLGWHVPTDAEWSTLGNFLGGNSIAGGKMKSTGTEHWTAPNVDATNESGFSGLPGSNRSVGGMFPDRGFNGDWWSSTFEFLFE